MNGSTLEKEALGGSATLETKSIGNDNIMQILDKKLDSQEFEEKMYKKSNKSDFEMLETSFRTMHQQFEQIIQILIQDLKSSLLSYEGDTEHDIYLKK
jgi:hypothetical protein